MRPPQLPERLTVSRTPCRTLLRDVPDPVAWGSGDTPGVFPMCWPGPRSQAGAMNTNTVNPEARLRTDPPFGTGSRRTALRRPVQDSVVAGVAAGLARYLGVDVMIIRLAFVVLTIFGGAGIPLYLAGLLLIPEEGSDRSIASSLIESLRSRSQ
jgi:phage shock protein PspC (stress-responsive transcriptional regulator)